MILIGKRTNLNGFGEKKHVSRFVSQTKGERFGCFWRSRSATWELPLGVAEVRGETRSGGGQCQLRRRESWRGETD